MYLYISLLRSFKILLHPINMLSVIYLVLEYPLTLYQTLSVEISGYENRI